MLRLPFVGNGRQEKQVIHGPRPHICPRLLGCRPEDLHRRMVREFKAP